MRICLECNEKVYSNISHCPYCGTGLDEAEEDDDDE